MTVILASVNTELPVSQSVVNWKSKFARHLIYYAQHHEECRGGVGDV